MCKSYIRICTLNDKKLSASTKIFLFIVGNICLTRNVLRLVLEQAIFSSTRPGSIIRTTWLSPLLYLLSNKKCTVRTLGVSPERWRSYRTIELRRRLYADVRVVVGVRATNLSEVMLNMATTKTGAIPCSWAYSTYSKDIKKTFATEPRHKYSMIRSCPLCGVLPRWTQAL